MSRKQAFLLFSCDEIHAKTKLQNKTWLKHSQNTPDTLLEISENKLDISLNALDTSLQCLWNCPSIFFETPLKRSCNIFETSLKHPEIFLWAPLRLSWNTFELSWNSFELLQIPLKPHWKLPWNTLQSFKLLSTHEPPLKLLETPFNVTWNTPLKLSWNTLEISLKPPWNTLEASLKHSLNF